MKNIVKDHFENEAARFDSMVVKSIPFYFDMLDALVSSIPTGRSGRLKILDLGCGTGTISKLIKERFPGAFLTCVDFSQNMIKISQDKLKRFKSVEFVVSDCRTFDFSSGFDAVVTSLTLHHLRRPQEKKALYKKIFKGLRKGGVFYAADLVIGQTRYLQELNLKKWHNFLVKHLSPEFVRDRKMRYEKEDRPFKLMDELNWLKAAGFKDMDVVWKNYHFAVYGGRKI